MSASSDWPFVMQRNLLRTAEGSTPLQILYSHVAVLSPKWATSVFLESAANWPAVLIPITCCTWGYRLPIRIVLLVVRTCIPSFPPNDLTFERGRSAKSFCTAQQGTMVCLFGYGNGLLELCTRHMVKQLLCSSQKPVLPASYCELRQQSL